MNDTSADDNFDDFYRAGASPYKAVLMGIISGLIILGNIFNIAVILYNENLRTVSGSFMVALASADLGLGIFVVPFTVQTTLVGVWTYPDRVCQYVGFMSSTFTLSSIFLLMDLSIDRYVSIAKPIEYYSVMTNRKCIFMILKSWVVASVYSMGPFLGWGRYGYSYKMYICTLDIFSNTSFGIVVFVLVIPPFIIMFILNIKIFIIARNHAKQLYYIRGSQGQVTKHYPITAIKAAKTVAIVIATFAISWIPMVTAYGYSVFANHRLAPNLSFSFMYLAVANSFWNCVIYSTTNLKFRLGARKLVLKMKNRMFPRSSSVQNLKIERSITMYSISTV
ncbi:adenosine receptor A1-like [Branchiostoma lanceolatum]|uniref:adenosine receptor A1-like n=1 Tax=Branchiostoma lanceolatum TaxID=7740 RepID=UPI003456DC47